MRSRPTFWILLCLLGLAGAWLFWPHAGRRAAEQNSPAHPKSFATPGATTVTSAATAPNFFTTTNAAAAKTNEFAYRLSNTRKSIGELGRDEKAILLENALIDTRRPLNFSIPKNLQSPGDPGAYIVQAKGPIDAAFRRLLAGAGAEIISYIPNNAYLVRVSAGGAGALSGSAQTASVIPYEPYYKISSSVPVGTKQATASVAPQRNSRRQPTLLELAVRQKPLPPGTILTLGIFNSGATATFSQIEKLGGTILTTNLSPFGLMLRVVPPENWTALAVLPGVQIMEPYHARVRANDLTRAITGVASNSITPVNYLNLSGSNVLVAIDDSGVDATHPDLVGRIFGSLTNDTVGHGTHVAGILAGNGTESMTVTNASGSIMPGTNGQFRGKAPLAKLFTMDFQDSDQDLQQGAALTNALISNNSWNFDGDTAYDLEAASYDAATRDALPFVTGSQPVLFVFSAGNSGGGQDNGVGGNADTILSPATAKDVIAVGAIEQLRDITNLVVDANNNTNAVWFGETDSSNQVAGFSSRGNVGIGTEGTSGRYKPDVVAPGTFVISTRSQQWDEAVYYFQNPTNHDPQEVDNIVIQPGAAFANSFQLVPDNAIQVTIQVVANSDSPSPFPDLPIFMGLESSPNTYDYETTNNLFSIPPDGPGLPAIIADQNLGFNYAVSNNTSEPINVDIITDVITTNNTGNYGEVLSNLNDSIGTSPYYYRYESGTSMAAPDVSGMLALMQDYFTNTLHAVPSPALLKALLVNGTRPIGNYNFHETDGKNYQGWGLINLPNSVPSGSTNVTSGSNSVFYLDQSPTNSLATGDSHTFLITVATNSATRPLRVTLAWTDPAGNPAAAIKLVNNLDLVVATTNSTATNIYYGNDIPAGSVFNSPGSTNAPNLDTINNIENVFLQNPVAGSYFVTVVGRGVNVNAVTAQTNNVVQDYALVVSCGDGLNPGAITVTRQPNVSNPTGDQLITDVVTTNSPLFNQFVGANSPLLGTNTIAAGGNTAYASNAIVTVGMTNQWHFYVVTNNGANASFTNAAFITFLPDTLSIPRMGVFAGSDANSTTPEADIDLYVTSLQNDPNAYKLTNLDLTEISNCVHGVSGDSASLSRGGTEFVVYTNSAPGQVYYVGVKSEVQMASEYAFLPVFTSTPFSQIVNGNEIVNGIPLPVAIPDGSPTHPGAGYVFGLALQPMDVQNVTVSNQITHQNLGDLVGVLTHDGQSDVLNNHDSLFNDLGVYNFLYDDSQFPLPNSQPSDGPGSLLNFVGQQAVGAWILTEVDDSLTQTGSVTGFSLTIQPHIDPSKQPVSVTLQPGEFFTTYVDVPTAATNLTIFATNIIGTANPPVGLFVRYNEPPTQSNFDATTLLNTPVIPSPDVAGFISIGLTNQPPLRPGRYYIGLFNPSVNAPQTVFYFAKIDLSPAGPTWLDYHPAGPTPLPDDAVTTSSISVTNTDPIADMNVGIRVDHPRISDLVFHLISPDGTRYLLMENRGGTTTNGAGLSYLITNTVPVNHNGDANAYTNTINTGTNSGTITLNYDVFELPDTIDVYYQGTDLFHFDPPFTGNDISGSTNIAYGPGTSTEVTIIINAGGNTNYPGTAWTYTVISTVARYAYLAFTEDTNLTTTPIKFAPPPFVPNTNNYSTPTNVPILAGPILNPANNHSYYLLQSNSWTNAEAYAKILGGDLATINDSAEDEWVFTNFIPLVPLGHELWIGYYDPSQDLLGGSHASNFVWADGETPGYTDWYVNGPVEPDNTGGIEFYTAMRPLGFTPDGSWNDESVNTLNYGVVEVPPRSSSSLSNLYYQPEQSISPLIGTQPNGTWQLEVQDNRVGAYDSNSPPALLDWQLAFVFAGTNSLRPPVFTNALPESTNMNELTTLIITNGAVAGSTNLTLTYSLTNAPSFATIDPNTGIITLSPLEADGPGTYVITTVVTDDGTPALSAENSFALIVNEVNTPPFWPPGVPSQNNYAIPALNTLTVSDTATDTDIPVNPLTYQLVVPPTPTNAVIDTNTGIITWTPTLAQTNSTYTFETIVTDTNIFALTNKSLSNTNFFTVTVLPPLSPTNGVPQTNTVPPGGIVWFLINVPTNADVATNILLFATGTLNIWFSTNSPPTVANLNDVELITNATSGSSILSLTSSPASIVPGAAYFLGVQNTNSFPVTNAIEVDFHFRPLTNTAPFWITNPPTNTIAILTTLVVTNTATDTDSPPNTLTYRLVTPPTPANAVINPGTGIITWTPTVAQGNTTNTFETIVTDNGTPNLSATNFFIVIVRVPPYSYTMAATAVTGTNAQLNGMATPNGSPAFAWFQWGTSSLYGNQTTPIVSIGSGRSVVYVTNLLAGLSLPQACHYRLVTSNTVAVAYGFDQIFDVGSITAWGSDSAGQTNVPATLANAAVAVAGGLNDSLALGNNGQPIGWGDDSSGQTDVPANLTNAVAIASGSAFNLALINNRRVVAWGDNSVGQTNVPANLSNVVAIASGGFHSLALRTNGTVVAWGWNVAHETNVPVNLSNIVAVAGGDFHSLALKNDGTVVAWGDNSDGETNVPAGLNTVVAIAAGDFYSMALKTNGTVVVWGNNSDGETNVQTGLSNVVAIAAGSQHCLALKSDGTVVAWGNDAFSQTNVPLNLTNVAAVAGGGDHSLALVALAPVNLVNHAPFFLATPTNQSINVQVTISVTNTAADSDIPVQTLTYTLQNPPANASINSSNGIITFAPSAAQAGTTNTITTVVADNGVPSLGATNSFFIIVYPLPVISSVTFATNALTLHWFAPTNDQFNVQWATNLAPPITWTFFSNNISPVIVSSATGAFSFTDTNALLVMKFYRLILLP